MNVSNGINDSEINASENEFPQVSIIVPVYNEERYIQGCLTAITEQTYPTEHLEVLVIDGMSQDASRKLVRKILQQHPFVRLLQNPKKITSEAVNIGIRASSGEIIIIVSGHAIISNDYVAKCVDYLMRENSNIGGVGPTLEHVGMGLFGNLVARALSSRFGVGNAYFRFSTKPRFVDTIAYGAYRRAVFDKVGLWDIDLVRNHDIEFNHRVKANGWRLLLAPDLGCKYYTRNSLKAFLSQNYGNGFWNVLTLIQQPQSLGLRHFVPLVFVLMLIFSAISTVFFPGAWPLLAIIGIPYMALAIMTAAIKAIIHRQFSLLLLSFVFPLLHISYGIGSIAACFRLIWLKIREKTVKTA